MPTLTWLTRDDDLKRAGAAPYRLLEPVPELGAGDPNAGNMLIQGDNLDALKALLPYYAGRVKCIYIDPPYNTRSAFEHYDDNLQHAEWLAIIYPRLELLRELLSEDGSIWVTVDDHEGHYLKIIMDEIYGRSNFLCSIAWEKRYSPAPDTKDFAYVHDIIHVYRKTSEFKRNLLPATAEQTNRYKNPDDDERGPWKSMDYTCRYSADDRPNLYYPIIHPKTGEEIWPKRNRVWAMSRDVHLKNEREDRIWWGTDKNNSVPALKNFLSDVAVGMMPMSIWKHDVTGHNQEAKREIIELFASDIFDTPKPERLIHRVLQVATNTGDLVLDSFLGSGTTAAVAHKMGRRFIGIEMGEHAVSHCAPRLRKVIDGEQGGISASVNWQGGGGFSFYRLGEPVFDDDGRINPAITFAPLAAHIWFSEFGIARAPGAQGAGSPWLGAHEGRGLALLYNGILGDKSVSGGNVLTLALLKRIRADAGGFAGPITIYGEASRLGPERLRAEGVTFKQTPYDVRAR